MVLGMHPAILYPRRSQFRPPWEISRSTGSTARPAKARVRASAASWPRTLPVYGTPRLPP